MSETVEGRSGRLHLRKAHEVYHNFFAYFNGVALKCASAKKGKSDASQQIS